MVEKELKGVKGWLALYACLGVFNGASTAFFKSFTYISYINYNSGVSTAHMPLDAIVLYYAYLVVTPIIVLLSLLFLYACFKLFRATSGAVSMVKRVLLANIALLVAMCVIFIVTLFLGSEKQWDFIAEYLRALFVSLLWYLYLLKSKRVKATFPNG